MKTHKCEKDGKYIISTNSDCVVTDVETGIVLAVVLAKTQKVIQAISDSFTTSVECSVRPFVEATSDIDLIGGGEDYLPAGYKRIEYLESSGTQRIDINYQPTESTGYYTDYENTSSQLYQHVLSASADGVALMFTPHFNGADYRFFAVIACADETFRWNITDVELLSRKKVTFNYLNTHICEINGQHKFDVPTSPLKEYQEATTGLFMHPASVHQNEGLVGRLYAAEITEGEKIAMNFIPVLDDTGTPCMYDKVSHQSYYNSGSGDFIYPIDEYDTQTLDLDDVVYGKMTEYGIRRLYKVPAGETVTLTDYALANGYKEIIEPPMPREGYWVSQWKETDTQLILEYVETEAPAEEV